MANQIFMRVNEVAEELGISIPFAYRIIRQMNEELAKTGCITIAGRIDRKFFHEKFYGTRSETERKENYVADIAFIGFQHRLNGSGVPLCGGYNYLNGQIVVFVFFTHGGAPPFLTAFVGQPSFCGN